MWNAKSFVHTTTCEQPSWILTTATSYAECQINATLIIHPLTTSSAAPLFFPVFSGGRRPFLGGHCFARLLEIEAEVELHRAHLPLMHVGDGRCTAPRSGGGCVRRRAQSCIGEIPKLQPFAPQLSHQHPLNSVQLMQFMHLPFVVASESDQDDASKLEYFLSSWMSPSTVLPDV